MLSLTYNSRIRVKTYTDELTAVDSVTLICKLCRKRGILLLSSPLSLLVPLFQPATHTIRHWTCMFSNYPDLHRIKKGFLFCKLGRKRSIIIFILLLSFSLFSSLFQPAAHTIRRGTCMVWCFPTILTCVGFSPTTGLKAIPSEEIFL